MTNIKKPIPPRCEHTQPNGATFYTFANQKDIIVRKPKAKEPFLQLDEQYMWRAMQELGGGGFKLYCYLASNKNKYNFALTHKDVGKLTGMSKSTYDRAVKELINKQYLVQYKESNHYRFVIDPTFNNGMEINSYLEWCDSTWKDNE